MTILYLAIGAGALALAFALALTLNILRQDQGSEVVQFIGRAIQDGANSFLSREYLMLSVFVVSMFAILAIFIDYDVTNKVGSDRDIPSTAIAYLAGAIGSALAGEGLRQAEQTGIAAIVVLGHPEYYPRFGFVPSSR
ncbi:MAG: sodium/proton-translocating pyrophosphatase, partial [SAR202 cluster bacterium]|nr:sodium/proton-translocating pyrophosphatase [SAR202 cluster bacterium]